MVTTKYNNLIVINITSLETVLCCNVFVGVDEYTEFAVLEAASFGFNDTTEELFWWFDILAETRFEWGAGEAAEELLLLDGPETYYHWFGPIVPWPNHAFGSNKSQCILQIFL